jgi:hypothetical protein
VHSNNLISGFYKRVILLKTKRTFSGRSVEAAICSKNGIGVNSYRQLAEDDLLQLVVFGYCLYAVRSYLMALK